MAVLTKPEGDGGWTPARRHEELSARAAAAGVTLSPTPDDVPAPPDGPLGLADVLALATRGNRRIAEAEHTVAAAGQRVRDARGRLLPNTVGTGRYTWYTDPLTNSIALAPGVLPPGTNPVVEIREKESGRVGAVAQMPIDVSGELWRSLKAAQAGYRGERARLWATTLAQQVVVIRAYFQLLEAQRLREVTEQTLAAEREQLDHAQARFDAGRLTKNDLLVVQVTLADAEQRLIQRDLAIDEARWTLNQTVGLPVDAPTTVVDLRARPAIPAADEALREAFANNPVLLALTEEQQRLEDVATSLERSRLPRFHGGGAVDWTSEKIVQPQRVGSAFVGFSWDLGTDGRREAQIAEARIAADRNRVAIERELRELEAAVRATRRSAEERLAAMAAAETAVHQADENLRIRRQQFDVGRATSDDVLDALALLARTRATLATALYQAQTRRAELQQLVGLPLDALVADSR